jgi:hypothetical protein
MARCEVCGVDQFPADTVVTWDEDGERHFYCSKRHQMEAEAGTPPQNAAERVAETASEAGTVLQDEETPPVLAEEAARVLSDTPRRRKKGTVTPKAPPA